MVNNLFNSFKDYKCNNNIERLEELYLYFEKIIYNISKSMPYDEGHTDLIIEFIKLINSNKLDNCRVCKLNRVFIEKRISLLQVHYILPL